MNVNRLLIIPVSMLFISIILLFLGLHDIYRDYIGTEVIKRYIPESIANNFPQWTNCPIEWAMIQISWIFLVCSLIFFLVIYFQGIKKVQ